MMNPVVTTQGILHFSPAGYTTGAIVQVEYVFWDLHKHSYLSIDLSKATYLWEITSDPHWNPWVTPFWVFPLYFKAAVRQGCAFQHTVRLRQTAEQKASISMPMSDKWSRCRMELVEEHESHLSTRGYGSQAGSHRTDFHIGGTDLTRHSKSGPEIVQMQCGSYSNATVHTGSHYTEKERSALFCTHWETINSHLVNHHPWIYNIP